MPLLFIGTNSTVSAVDAASGQELWRTTLKTGVFGSRGCQDVAVVDDGPYVFAGCYGELFCLDAATGQVLWKNALQGLGYNDICMSIAGKAVVVRTTEAPSSSSSSMHHHHR